MKPASTMSNSENLPETLENGDKNDYGIMSAPTGDVRAKDIQAAGVEDNPLVKAAGHAGNQERGIETDAIHKYLADLIYDSNAAFVREFLQNAETACLRACRLLLRHHEDYGEGWLTREVWVNKETGELLTERDNPQKVLAEWADVDMGDLRPLELPRALHEIVEAARSIGYDPTIEVDLYHDERKVVFEDNGIGMTTKEVQDAYNTTGLSGAREDGDTGGMMGMGALTFVNMTGEDGAMEVKTRTLRPEAPEDDHGGIHFYAHLAGINPLPVSMPDDFRGSEFTVPIQEEVNIDKFQGWMETYASMLRVPVLYHEHVNGATPVKEEYGGQSFVEYHDNPPVVIDRPGEFTVVAGQDVSGSYKDPDTWLVSMEIERNADVSIDGLFNAAIQIHNEQGLIVMGPNRGKYRDDVDRLDENDIVLPQPTADRDRLQKGEKATQFWRYIRDEIKNAELALVEDFANRMDDADHPGHAIMADPEDWSVFKKMVNHHGPYNVFESERKFMSFVQDRDEFDWTDEKAQDVFSLFDEIEWAKEDSRDPNLKGGRDEVHLGNVLAEATPEHVFMGVSVSEDKHSVVYNTFDDAAVISVENTKKYNVYGERFGFKLLKDVPNKPGDHDFDIPAHLVNKHKRAKRMKEQESDDGADEDLGIGQSTIKLRTKTRNKQIDTRPTLDRLVEKMEQHGHIDGKDRVVLFPQGQDFESVSDNIHFQKYAAIASVTMAEWDELKQYPWAMTKSEFIAEAESTVIATEKGGRPVTELVQDGEFVVLAYAGHPEKKRFLTDDDVNKRIRQAICEYGYRNTYYSAGEDDPDDPELVFAVADQKTLNRAEFVLRHFSYTRDGDDRQTQNHRLTGVKFGYSDPIPARFDWNRLHSGELRDIRTRAETPSWNDDSPVYGLMKDSDEMEALCLGFHDIGIDPSGIDADKLRSFIKTGDASELESDN